MICHECGYASKRAGQPVDAGGIRAIAIGIVPSRRSGYVRYLCHYHLRHWLLHSIRRRTRERIRRTDARQRRTSTPTPGRSKA